MVLKSLDIQGFKSFPDRTHIDFNSGITVVVGPNGSGKSNISDAIRWVLGEQSSKALRGERMEDVIFAGSEQRKPMGSAEVSLTFDNADGGLKSDYREVTVTRKYYRSGDSDFYINRKSVRLRDIHELFMDTGLGRDGYSMIGQGRIDEILSVKSEERREVFDEAAGISKYRYRREEAEKRLADALANLERINISLEDMETRIEPMSREAEKERKYNDLSERLRAADVGLMLFDLEGVRPRLEQARAAAESIERDIAENTTALEDAKAQGDSLVTAALEAQRQYEALRALSEEDRRLTAENDSRLAVDRAALEHYERDRRRIEGEIEEAGRSRDDTEAKIAAAEAEASALVERQGIEREKLSRLDERRTELLAKLAERSAAAAALSERERQSRETLSGLQAGLSAVEASLRELRRQLELMDGDETARREAAEQAGSRCTALEGRLAELKTRLPGLVNIEKGFSLKLESRARRAQELQGEIQRLTIDAAGVQNRERLLAELERDYEGFNRAVRLVMREQSNGGLRGIHGPVSALMKTDDRYVAAAETALGAAMQNIVVDSEEDARAAIGLLKSRDAGRATFLPLTAIRGNLLNERGLEAERGFVGILSQLISYDRHYEAIFTNLLGRTVVAENLDDVIAIARSYRNRFRIVTLDGQVINAGGSMTGGSLNKSTGVLSRANELERLRKSLPALTDRLSAAKAAASEAERERASLAYQLQVASDERKSAEGELAGLERELTAERSLHANLNAELENRDSRRADMLKRIAACEGEGEQTEAKIAAKNTAIDELRAQNEALGAAVAGINGELSRCGEDIAGLRERLSEYTGEERMRRSEAANLRVAAATAGSRAVEGAKALEALDAEQKATEAEISGLEARAAELRAQSEAKSRLIEAAAVSRAALDNERNELERRQQELNKRGLELERAKLHAESRLEAAQGEEESLTGRLWDAYGLTRMTAADYRREITERRPVEREIESLKKSIRELGTIYPGAIREYESLVSRRDFMTAQRDDAEKSRLGIEEIIRDIGERMALLFREQFELINRSFSQTFAEIFSGGSAEVLLTDPVNVLESGIEIRARMPGKSSKLLSLLSGGERALTAIALYFAILKVRPAPFCVLDEIESALDEINVKRFADYLGSLKGGTQFIVISHRRGTMEAADMLYGVTMARRGVSQLLALNVAEAEKNFIKD